MNYCCRAQGSSQKHNRRCIIITVLIMADNFAVLIYKLNGLLIMSDLGIRYGLSNRGGIMALIRVIEVVATILFALWFVNWKWLISIYDRKNSFLCEAWASWRKKGCAAALFICCCSICTAVSIQKWTSPMCVRYCVSVFMFCINNSMCCYLWLRVSLVARLSV